MGDQEPSSSSLLLNRYRSDRRKLLEFVLSSGPNAAGLSSLSGVDFDSLSADYVLDCLSSGVSVDVSEANKKYLDELSYPTMIHSQSGGSFYLLSDQEWSGSPPQRPPPPIIVKPTFERTSRSSSQMGSSSFNDTASAEDYGLISRVTFVKKSKNVQHVKIPTLGLPNLRTGLSDDDLRESAYEILLASVASSGVDIYLVEEKKKEKNSKFLLGLKSKRDKTQHPQSHSLDRHSQLIRTIREQMQISEAMDICIRRRLQLPARRTQSKTDIPQISLGLLNSIFKSDFSHEKSYIQWKSRQVGILEELLQYSANLAAPDLLVIKSSLAKIKNEQEWEKTMSPSERVEVLSNIRHVALNLSSLPGQIGIKNETYYWTAGYRLNIRLYEKLLLSVFDILDEGQLVDEVDEILSLIKSTWSTLGITQKIHDAIFGWVLFQQFVETDEVKLLEYATLQLQKLESVEADDREKIYIDSLACLKQCGRNEVKLDLIKAIFFSISTWSIGKLQDYHLHFGQQPGNFKRVMTLLSTAGIPIPDDNGAKMQLRILNLSDKKSSKIVKSYVERAIENAYKRVVSTIDLDSKVEGKHLLCLLANGLRLIVEREIIVFYPVLREWYPKAGAVIAMQLHHIYGEKLKIFLKEVSCLSEDVKSVLPAAYLLDQDLTKLYTIACGANNQDVPHYPIGEVSKPIILDWVIAQHSRLLEWTGRAFDLEGWEPLSSQQRQAPSVVEIFRIVEETVDQLFGLKLPMDITHLQALLSVIFHTLDAYLVKMLDQLVEKNHLYPSAPPLTRYKETSMAILKKKVLDDVLLDEHVIKKLNHLTVSKLCVRLNTLKYIQKQIDELEDGIRKSWGLIIQSDKNLSVEKEPCSSGEEIDDLFSSTFDIIRDTSFNGISKICDFIGPRIVFWDLRDAFICGLYRGNVEDARLDHVLLPHFDSALDQVCGLIDDALRDRVISSICQASMEAFAWVLLDGGPSRAFSDSDIVLMEDDLAMLKEFFVANGEGLPNSLVEQEAKFSEKVLGLYSLETETVIQMLMTASEHISMGLESHDHVLNVHTLMRVLCHKKDSEASRFLKMQYQLPMSSEYEDGLSKDATSIQSISNLLQQSASFRWNMNSHSNLSTFKKKFQEASSRSFRM